MSLILQANTYAMTFNRTNPFAASGGVPPYTYSVVGGGAGGSINPSTGLYTSPNQLGIDIVQVVDANLDAAQTIVSIGSVLQLVCDILQTELGLAPGRTYVWDQKITMPIDKNLFLVVSMINPKPFGNSNRSQSISGVLQAVQAVNMRAIMSIDIMSRGTEARDRKEEVILALNSNYARQQAEFNSFSLAILPISFVNLSEVDGAAIPYRYRIDVAVLYFVSKTTPISYYDTFTESLLTNE